MESLELAMVIAVLQEMLSWAFYPLIIAALILTTAFVVLIIKEKALNAKRFVKAQVVGLVGGLVGVIVLFWLTQSGPSDIGAPIDAFVLLLTYGINFIGFTTLYYTITGCLSKYPKRSTPPKSDERLNIIPPKS